jgi:hypothetical protein
VTAKMPRRATTLGRRAYSGDAADGPAFRGVHVRMAARTRGPRGGGASGCGGLGRACLGPCAASGGVGADAGALLVAYGDARARDVAARRRSACFCFAGTVLEIELLQFFV